MASPFWTYFHDKLNWLPIFRQGPVSALMKGLALHMDDVRSDILWLREQWNPATCEMWLVERYGVSRGIFRNRFDTDESYRKRVVHAYAWHKLGGKVRGVTQILAENGFLDAEIVSVNDVRRHDAMFMHGGKATYNAGLCWAQFDVKFVEIPEIGLNRDVLDFFRWLINEYKPARSILRAMSWSVSLADETDFIEKAVFHVAPKYLDIRPWGFPSHNGQIHYGNGLSRLHDDRLKYDGKHPHTFWQPYGHVHDCVIDPLALRMRTEISEDIRYAPLHNGFLLHDHYGIHGNFLMPCVDRAAANVSGKWLEPAKSDEKLDASIRQEQFDDIGRYHDGCLTHGQRRVCLHTGAFNHSDSRIYHGVAYSGNSSFRAVRHDGFARYRSEASHQLWKWLSSNENSSPNFTYDTFSDHSKMRFTTGMEDDFAIGDDWNLSVLRYAFYKSHIRHDAANRHSGKEI